MKNFFTNVKRSQLIVFILSISSFWSICGAILADKDQLIEDLETFKVIIASEGEDKLQSTKHIQTDDIIEYQVAYHNQGHDSAKQLLATLPVPKGMTYLPSDTYPSHPHASLDGETFVPMPLIHWVRLADGSRLQRQVPYSQYRFLQWNLGRLEAGSEATVRARVRVNR